MIESTPLLVFKVWTEKDEKFIFLKQDWRLEINHAREWYIYDGSDCIYSCVKGDGKLFQAYRYPDGQVIYKTVSLENPSYPIGQDPLLT